MRSPFQTETEAFSFLLLTVAAFAVITVASLLGGAWVGVPVSGALTVAVAYLYLTRGRRARPIKTAPAHVGAADERRILVVAGDTVADATLVEEIERKAAGYRTQVLVLCPAVTSPVRHWASDLDGAISHAHRVLDENLARLRAAGVDARGEIGDEDPLRAIEDALRTFGADEIIISAPPGDQAVVTRAREGFALPVTHVVGAKF